MNEIDHLLENIGLGSDAKAFVESPIGQYLQRQAQEDINEFIDHLRDMEADRGKDDLMRMEINARMIMFKWLKNAMNAAEAANIQLEESESED